MSTKTGFMKSLTRFLHELTKRRVLRVAVGYAVVGWLLVEVADVVFPALLLPDWSLRFVLVIVLLGFPFALVLAWLFDITPSGIERVPMNADEAAGHREESATDAAMPPEADTAAASVAVLPFENLSEDPRQAFLADGIAAELHSSLSRVNRLRVAARQSSFAYRGSTKNIRDIARELGVRYILSGSLLCAGNHIRVIGEFDDAQSGTQIWSETYDRDLDDIFAVVQSIAQSIASAFGGERLRVEIMEARRRPTTSLDAWGLVQKARAYLIDYTSQSINDAVDCLRTAIKLDPNYNAALATLGVVLGERFINGLSNTPADDRKIALDATECATTFAPGDPFVIKMSGCTWAYFGETEKSLSALRKAVRIAPFDFGAWGYLGWPLTATGKPRHLAELQRIVDRLLSSAPHHPGVPYWLYHKSVACTCEGIDTAAVEFARKSVDAQPNFVPAWMQYANALGYVGDREHAGRALDQARSISPAMTPEFFESLMNVMCENAEIIALRLGGLKKAGALHSAKNG
ncbi:MAG: hypothetical protein V3U59_00800 [Gammaproteobacteria bacterium]